MVETTARQYLLSAILFSAILAGIFSMIGMAADPTDPNLVQYNQSLNKLNELNDKTGEIRNQVQQEEPQSGLFGILDALIQNTIGVFNLVWESFDVMSSVLSDLSKGAFGFSLPTWFTTFIIAFITISIGFAILAALFKWRI